MDEKRYTSGEIAAAAGLTIRAVQHYDNIGLLRSAGRTEGGRRYYTQADLIQLQQIVLYKSVGFSLEQIKKNLLFEPNRDELLEVFKNQQLLLLQKIEHLHTSFVALSIMSDRVQEEKEVPLMLFLQFFSALPGDDIFAQANQMLDEKQQDILSQHFHDLEQTRQFYHKWKEILIEAMLLIHENFSSESQEAQDLVRRWWDEIISFTDGDLDLIKQLSELNLEERMLPKNSEMLNSAKRFMDDAFAIFSAK